jgi:uncharacterized protein YggU (UPF0235/DUF167 family)
MLERLAQLRLEMFADPQVQEANTYLLDFLRKCKVNKINYIFESGLKSHQKRRDKIQLLDY